MPVITQYDSAAFMHRATAQFLRGEDFRVKERVPRYVPWSVFVSLVGLMNQLPESLKIRLSVATSQGQAVKSADIASVNEDQIAQDIVAELPRRKYPAIAIGSSNGALVHLYAALGIPWLPQTNLMLINRDRPIESDNMAQDAIWAREFARPLLERNRNLKLHQMNDPAQDRYMAINMTYFRLKFLQLPAAYRQFIEDCLEPGGDILVVNCQNRWPATKLSDRHYFQVGGYGGITIDEYLNGGPRVEEFLARNGSRQKRFILPEITGDHLEAEWGFEESMLDSIGQLAKERGYGVKELYFTDPQDPVRPIADFYRDWYTHLGLPTNKLLVESFMLVEPYWCLRTGCIPYWAVFTGQPSYDDIAEYVGQQEWDYIYLTLFSNIVRSIGVPEAREWRRLAERARRDHALVGVDADKFPFDLLSAFAFFEDVPKKIPFRYPKPPPVPLDRFEQFLASKRCGYQLEMR
jgi:hypothetical protein